MWKLMIHHNVHGFIDNFVIKFEDGAEAEAKRWYDHYCSYRYVDQHVRLWNPNGKLVHRFDNRKRKH